MQAAAEERAAAAAAREMETVRLRAQQERAADTQAQIDELRARRCALIRFANCLCSCVIHLRALPALGL